MKRALLLMSGGARGAYEVGVAEHLINYTESVGVDELVTTLRNFQAPNAAFTGLGPNENLNLAARTVVLHGTSRSLPASVQSIGGNPASVTLLVACGTIQPVDK